MRGIAIPLDELLGGMSSNRGQERDATNPVPEAQVATLSEAAERYAAGCPFKPGDLVTPRKGFNLKGAGDPCVVVEVPEVPYRNFETSDPHDNGNPNYGGRLDVRILCFATGDVVAYWGESWKLEPYTGPGAGDV